MTNPKIIAAVLTVAALGATPGVAAAAGADKCPPNADCRLVANHNEVLA